MSPAVAARRGWAALGASEREWDAVSVQAPQLAATMRRYLIQLGTFLAPRSVDAAAFTLRQFAGWLVANTDVAVVADISRTNVEDYKVWLAGRPGVSGPWFCQAGMAPPCSSDLAPAIGEPKPWRSRLGSIMERCPRNSSKVPRDGQFPPYAASGLRASC